MVKVAGRISAAAKYIRGALVNRIGWTGGLVRDWYTGAWQNNHEKFVGRNETYYAVFACMTLIASDIAKLPIRGMVQDKSDGTWTEERGQLSKLIKKPNDYQNKIQFVENWILSKLLHGNTYVLKRRDRDGNVVGLFVLDPSYVQVLVSDSGAVYYQLATDHLTQVTGDNVSVPASEIIHDRFNCLYHPLVGLSPIYAASLAAQQGLAMQNNTVRLFNNGGTAPGILSAEGQIDEKDAARIKAHWESEYGGANNFGKVAVLGSGLKYQTSSITSVDAQLIEQLKWTAEVVCGTFHVPPYMIGVGALPNASNVQALILQYYSQCLQILIESLEELLDDAYEVDDDEGFELDIEALLRMDGTAMAEYLSKLREGSILSINDARRKIGYKDVPGGDSIYMQQQNYSLDALIRRDATADPFSAGKTQAETPPATREEDEDNIDAAGATKLIVASIKSVGGEN